jgi:hypothetical protein
MSKSINLGIPAMLLIAACASDGTANETRGAKERDTMAAGASICASLPEAPFRLVGTNLPLRIIPPEAVESLFRPDQYRRLAERFDGADLLPAETRLSDYVLFIAQGETLNAITLFTNKLPCPRAGCAIKMFAEDRKTGNLAKLAFQGSPYSTTPPRVLFSGCRVEKLYIINNYRMLLGDNDIVSIQAMDVSPN